MKFSSISKPLAASALALLLPLSAYGAGLGRLTVNSALGQPFSGEIPILANKAEMEGLTATLAGDDAFREAGVEYLPALTSLHFSVVKRADGQAVLKITSDKPINDPFLDILVQLNWASGKLVREYTVLLDPPGMGRSQIAAPMEVSPPAAQPLAPPAPAPAPAPAEVRKSPAPSPTHKAAASPKVLRVRSGDTLSHIAQQVQPQGVTLDQTLVGLFDANPQAFAGNNMNRLKVGSRIQVPGKEAFAKTSPAAATKQVLVQVADWQAYRQRLAGAVSKAAPAQTAAAKPGQSVAGQATVKVAPAVAPSQTPVDVLKLSKGTGTGTATGAIAKEQALRDAESRTAALKQQIQEMKQLAALKEQALQPRPAATAPAQSAPAVPAAKPTVPPPAAKAPAVPAPVVTTSAPVSSSPGWYSVIQENPLYWAGGAAILLLGGTLWWMMGGGRRKGKEAGAKAFDDSVMTGGDLKTNTLIAGGASGGSINTGDTSFLTDFSQAGLGNIDTHDVDPIAEAEVYMAYGRDAQAEEILKEALAKTPDRQEIRMKLLEIYAARKNLGPFGSVASELYAAVEGQGPLWDKAAEMGRLIDPDNPLYGGVARKEEQPTAAPLGTAVAGAAAAAVIVAQKPAADFAAEAPAEPTASAEVHEFNFEGHGETPAAAEPASPEPEPAFRDTASGLDFDLGDLDFGTGASVAKGNGAGTEELPELGESVAPGLDFSGLDLDLDGSAEELGNLDEVSTKLDLARAYLEMGDKEGAREILQEVIAEGNQEQKSNAQSLMAAM